MTTRSRAGAKHGPVVIVGAGPYGLAAAAHLAHAGVDIRCFGEPLGFWKHHMPNGMVLRSRLRSSSIADPKRALTLARYGQATGKVVDRPDIGLKQFIDYGHWFQHQAIPEVDRRRVTSISRGDGCFDIVLADGETLAAAAVVVAAGLSPFPIRPRQFAACPPALVSHACDHADLGAFGGKPVIVIGAGQSALESAALLSERGASVELVARSSAIRWLPTDDGSAAPARRRIAVPPPPTDGGGRLTGWLAATPDVFRRAPERMRSWTTTRCLLPAGAGALRPRMHEVRLSLERYVVRAEADRGKVRLVLNDNSERLSDHVLLGTGYAIDVLRYPFISAGLASEIRILDGYPLLGPGLESSVPGLHFLGAPAALSFGPINRFVVGTWYAAPALTRRILGRAQRPLSFSF